ncbi:MAG: adenylosuccinate lyase [Rhodospirillales bacterium CG15_BIG_FIL_POST_REV_8_21_14_020_66_15]|nr:MAG: adenylosuccinate lyase [Rhodospirillales bacterium CG15_BIG_FIL_POST_REV_8_21_14_020_66_15]
MAAGTIDSTLFRDQFSTAAMRAVFDDAMTVQKWLDTEAALARAEASLSIIPEQAARDITRAADVSQYDLDAMREEMARTSHPIVPLVRAMAKACEKLGAKQSGEYVHWGATTQDIMDTGLVLQMKDALGLIMAALAELEANLVKLAVDHRDTPMAGRTHGQQALPVTFGYKAAVWLDEVRRHMVRLTEMGPRVLVGQFSGAVGTYAAIGARGPEVMARMMADLELGAPLICWHVAKDRPADFACNLALVAGTMGRIAHEVATLQRTELAELEEPHQPGKVGSSTMPQKRNPSICEGIQAIARLAWACVPPAFEGMMAEHERDKVANQGERDFIPRLCCYAEAAVRKVAYVTGGLTVRRENMRRNLDLTGGLLLSEAVMMKLGQAIGRNTAHDVVYEAAMEAFEKNLVFRDLLLQDGRVTAAMSAEDLDAILDPARYTGLSAEMVDRVLGG